jgi:hypothetical protein
MVEMVPLADLADAVVQRIGDVDIARGIQRHAGGKIQLRFGGRRPIAAETGGAVAGDGGDVPVETVTLRITLSPFSTK